MTTLQLLGWSLLSVAIAASVLLVLAEAATRVGHKLLAEAAWAPTGAPGSTPGLRDAEIDEAQTLLRDQGLPEEEIERRIDAVVAFSAAAAGYYLPAIPAAARNAPRRHKAS